MKTDTSLGRISTGVRNLDAVLAGGLPQGNLTVLAGTPGSGKTILSQQIVFKNASLDTKAIFFQTLSEPTAKTLKYLRQFDFYDQAKLDSGCIEFIDLGDILRLDGLEKAIELVMRHVQRVKPAFVVIDSFKVFEDLAKSREDLRKFTYEIAINLMAWECTALLLGEFTQNEIESNPLFSIVDGVITLKHFAESGEEQRFIQVVKMRGTNHSRDEHTFIINTGGLEIYAPRVTIRREPGSDRRIMGNGPERAKTGIKTLDTSLGDGIPWGSSVLVSGVAGTGKTILCLEFIYKGATEYGQKGVFFSFEETPERLVTAAHGMGWKLEEQIKKGNIEIVFVPQTEILVERDLLMMKDRIEKLGAKRVAIDSVSVFVHKIQNAQAVREKIFQIATLVQMAQAVGFFATDIHYGANQISRFGVEETVVDGVILLTSTENGYQRERYLEIYKLRNTAHRNGRHKMLIAEGGMKLVPAKG
ncbi:MAG: ATPase domain-containing protein [Bdellovibrionota bacterium]